MIICTILLLPLYIILQILIPLIQQLITNICSWVSSIIQVIVQVLSQVCNSLPWPLSLVCNWITTFVTTLQTVWNYICNTIVTTIITLVTYIVSLLIYIVRIICIILNLVIGIPAYILCLLKLSPPKKLKICVKVLTDENGLSQVTPLAIKQNIERSISVYKQCNIDISITGIEYIVKLQYLTTTSCFPIDILSFWHVWFSQSACLCCNQITVFFVDKITNASGCTFWGESLSRVDKGANTDDTVMAHEIGHILNLWDVNDPNNIMNHSTSPTAHNLTTFQCCFMRRSPFTTYF